MPSDLVHWLKKTRQDSSGRQTHIVANLYLHKAEEKVYYPEKDADGVDQVVAQRAVSASPDTWPERGNVTAFTYDADGRQLTQTLPIGVHTADAVSNLSW